MSARLSRHVNVLDLGLLVAMLPIRIYPHHFLIPGVRRERRTKMNRSDHRGYRSSRSTPLHPNQRSRKTTPKNRKPQSMTWSWTKPAMTMEL